MIADQEKLLQVELVYASVDDIYSASLQLPSGTTAQQAIEQSGLLEKCPEIDLINNKIGIFSKLRELDVRLSHGDRVEIYRPLLVDPKESRRRRAAVKEKSAQEKMRSGK